MAKIGENMEKEKFFEKFDKYDGIDISIEEKEMFYIYMRELLVWNEKINLTAITEPEEIILKHFIDSIIIEKYIKNKKIIDIGSGAGFPGIPIKIINKGSQVTLFDSLNKRITFLKEIISVLGLEGISAIHGRAEEFGRKNEYREKYDVAVSRAVAELSVLSEYMIPFVKVGGICVCMKGQNDEEVENAKAIIANLGGKIEKIEKYELPNTDIKRMVIIIRKERNTPAIYPRKINQIKK